MKAKFYLMMAATALLMSNCSQEEEALNQVQGGANTLIATIEGASRSTVTDGGVFSWATGDAISVWNSENLVTYTNTTGNSFSTTETNPGTPTGYAIYPANESHGISGSTVKVNMPATYGDAETTYAANTNAPMLATIGTGNDALAFKHLGGLMRFIVKNVPTSVTSFKFTANKAITGDFTVVEADGENVINAGNEATTNNEVTINFQAPTATSTMTFYVPLPVGEYGNYTVTVGDKSHESTGVTNTIARGTLLLMPVYTYTDSGLQKDEGASYVALTGGEQTMATDDGEVLIETSTIDGDVEAVLNLNYTPSANDAALTISDGSGDDVESGESKAKVVITPTETETSVGTLNINAPTLTVELGAGKYGSVEAKTATQTLIIGEDVEIEELILKGGNLKLEGDITLTKYDGSVWIESDCEIDLNAHKIISKQGTVIKVKAGNTLTIGGNGTVETQDTGCGAISNLGGTLVINGGTYKSETAGTIYCDRGEGATWNLTINGGTFEATNSTAVSLQNNNGETDEEKGLAEIKGGTFTGANGWHDLYLCNVIANIDVNNCTFTQNKGVCLSTKGTSNVGETSTWSSIINGQEVSLTNSNGMYLFPANVTTKEELQAAVNAGGKVVLKNNITWDGLDDCIWINNDSEIELGEYSLTATKSTVIKIAAGKTLTIGGNGTVETQDTGCGAISNLGGTLVINSGTYKSKTAGTIYCDRGNGATWNLTINGGTFTAESSTAVSLQNNNGEAEENQGLADINGGTFTGASSSYFDLYLCNVIAEIDTKNCTFTNNRVYLSTTGANIDGGTSTWSSIINGNEMGIDDNGLITIPESTGN